MGVVHDLDVLIGQAERREPYGLKPRRAPPRIHVLRDPAEDRGRLKGTAEATEAVSCGTAIGRKGGGRTSKEHHEISGEKRLRAGHFSLGRAATRAGDLQEVETRRRFSSALSTSTGSGLLRCALSVQPCEVSHRTAVGDVVPELGRARWLEGRYWTEIVLQNVRS
jgi:hypothetical protein